MADVEVLSRIKEAEDAYKKKVAQAHKDSESILASAKKEAGKIAHEGQVAAKHAYDEIRKAEEAKSAEERKKALANYNQKAEAIKKSGRANIKECSKYVISEFEKFSTQ